MPVYVGMRHWPPYVRDVLREIVEQGLRNILAVILAPHQCYASWEWYQHTVTEGLVRWVTVAHRSLTLTGTRMPGIRGDC